MTVLLTEAQSMARRKLELPDKPLGPILAKNFIRLGYAETVVQTARIAKLVTERTGKSMSRQRVSALTNAVRVDVATIESLAKGLGVRPEELLRD